jgi:tRNA threonylcarbamoyladenosine biosynthesis protein TsaE
VVVLAGDLGAGKTCLVQGAAAARGVTGRVTSPTFVIVRSYDGDVRIVHVDVYRLHRLGELDDLGAEEVFSDEAITFIEWGDAVAGDLPPHTTITITRDGEARLMTIHGARAADLAPALAGWAP